jgi:predicted DNA-binding protein YlxM (UPF0122 family)
MNNYKKIKAILKDRQDKKEDYVLDDLADELCCSRSAIYKYMAEERKPVRAIQANIDRLHNELLS